MSMPSCAKNWTTRGVISSWSVQLRVNHLSRAELGLPGLTSGKPGCSIFGGGTSGRYTQYRAASRYQRNKLLIASESSALFDLSMQQVSTPKVQ
jgi:hypothetical protein